MKRALDTIEDIDARLNKLRERFPHNKSKLQCRLDEFLAVDSKHVYDAVNALQLLRDVCIRTHGKDVWQVKSVSDAIEEHLIALRKETLLHNLEWCFTLLERAFDKLEAIQDPNSGTLLVKPPLVNDGIAHQYVKVISPERRSYTIDINGRVRRYNCCFNISAPDEETECCRDEIEIRSATLFEYINLAGSNPDLHRKDTDLEGLCSILDDHILRIRKVFESDEKMEEIVLSFPNGFRRPWDLSTRCF